VENISIHFGLHKANQFKDKTNIVTLCTCIPPYTFPQFSFFIRHY